MSKYGLGKESVYEKIKQDINNFPAFRFDWFIKSVRVLPVFRLAFSTPVVRVSSSRLPV